MLSNIYPLKLMDQSTEMWAVMNRLIELTGWIVLVVSVILLGVASHIDNYQPPEQSTTVQHKEALHLLSDMLPVRVHVFTCRILNQEFIILFDVVDDCQG